MPYGVLRIYDNAPGLADAIAAHQDDVRALLLGIRGFRSWGMIRTRTGAFSLTVCEDKAGCDESVRIAGDWVKANVPGQIAAPTVLEGETVAHRITADSVPA